MTERGAAALGLIGALAVVAVQLIVGVTWSLGHDDPTELELTRRCLEREKGLQVDPTVDDTVAASARGGTLRTVVEGNPVTVNVASSQVEVERLRAGYAAFGVVEPRVDVHGRYVSRWVDEPSPTQRQATYDCAY
jgi:hypothetical protein